jgi:hypothetical protein
MDQTPRSEGLTQMKDDGPLREQAREAIRARKLPERRPNRTWGGPGLGAQCAICDAPVKPDQVEVELEFAPGSSADNYHVHARCFVAWEAERRDLEPARTISVDAPAQSPLPATKGRPRRPSNQGATLSEATDAGSIRGRGFAARDKAGPA